MRRLSFICASALLLTACGGSGSARATKTYTSPTQTLTMLPERDRATMWRSWSPAQKAGYGFAFRYCSKHTRGARVADFVRLDKHGNPTPQGLGCLDAISGVPIPGFGG